MSEKRSSAELSARFVPGWPGKPGERIVWCMGLAFAVIIIVVFVLGFACGRRSGAVHGLERLGEAELHNRRRITGL